MSGSGGCVEIFGALIGNPLLAVGAHTCRAASCSRGMWARIVLPTVRLVLLQGGARHHPTSGTAR